MNLLDRAAASDEVLIGLWVVVLVLGAYTLRAWGVL